MNRQKVLLDTEYLYKLGNQIFPPTEQADKDGLIGISRDKTILSSELILVAYARGIFPWYTEDQPILWWSPNPRMIMVPGWFKPSKSLRRTVRSGKFEVCADNRFQEVIRECARVPRDGQDGTWITAEMEKVYYDLYLAGFAHSVEAYYQGKLAGGLYGVSLGKVFFGESMFHLMPDASKVAFYYLVELLKKWGFHFIDAQVYTRHLERLGAREVPRKVFLRMLRIALRHPTIKGNWDFQEVILNYGADSKS